jgi:hypothetical protein
MFSPKGRESQIPKLEREKKKEKYCHLLDE